jgi:dienelactone hydrolase
VDNFNVSYKFSDETLSMTNTAESKTNFTATKLKLTETEIAFQNEGLTLYGRLVMPQGQGKFPAVVIVQGSDTQSAIDTYEEPYLFASQGIACFVYDKRGTGRSQDISAEVALRTTPSFPLLASDLVAAVDTLSQLKNIDGNKIGLSGYSQGGWIAPLAAASSNKVKFVVVNYGLAMSVAEEAWQETPMKLADRGISDKKSLAELSDVDGALHQEVKNDFKEGWYDRIAAKIDLYKGRPWLDSMRHIPTTWLGFFLNVPKESALQMAPPMMRTIQPFYDPMVTLQKLNIPMYWLIAGEDIEAPPQLTIERIKKLKANGKPFDLKIYPNTDHGILLFKKEAGKKRVYTNYAKTYCSDVTRWVQAKTK